MISDMLKLDQTLHGYNNGHRLLASSVTLKEESARKMAMLSDLSGSELKMGFEEYYTCYDLPLDNKIIISKTWYAPEMKRPGCVWTHSFLIDTSKNDYLLKIVIVLIHQFRRPQELLNYDNYSEKIEIDISEDCKIEGIDNDKLKYILWSFFGYGDYVLVPAETSLDYAKEILYLWCLLRGDKTISTGSLSNRKIDKHPFNFQIVPQKISGGILHSSPELHLPVSRQSIKSYPIWIEKTIDYIERDELRDFYEFYSLFSGKYQYNRYFADFMKLYMIANACNHDIGICEALKGIEKIFPQENSIIGNTFLKAYCNGDLRKWGKGESSLLVMDYLIDISWMALPQVLFEQLTKECLVSDKRGCGGIFAKVLKGDLNYNAMLFLRYCATSLDVVDFVDFSAMNYGVCEVLVAFNPILASRKEIWTTTDEAFQVSILRILENNKNVAMFIDYIIPVVLQLALYDHVNKLYKIFGNNSFDYFIKALISEETKSEQVESSLIKICKKNSILSMHALHLLKDNLSLKQVLLFNKIVNPEEVQESDIQVFINYFWAVQRIRMEEDEIQRVAVFYMILILKSNQDLPRSIVREVSYTVHQLLLTNSLRYEYWEQLRKYIPQTSLFDSWDKCKRLRKAIRKKGYHLKKFEPYKDTDQDIRLL